MKQHIIHKEANREPPWLSNNSHRALASTKRLMASGKVASVTAATLQYAGNRLSVCKNSGKLLWRISERKRLTDKGDV